MEWLFQVAESQIRRGPEMKSHPARMTGGRDQLATIRAPDDPSDDAICGMEAHLLRYDIASPADCESCPGAENSSLIVFAAP